MKSAGPWNLRGLRPEAREAAREAARRSGMSVGEWLNSVIQADDDDDEPTRYADVDYEDGWRDPPSYDDRERRPHHDDREYRRNRPPRRRRQHDRDYEHVSARARDEFRETARAREDAREAARAREQARQAAGDTALTREQARKAARARDEALTREQASEAARARDDANAREQAREHAREAAHTRDALGEVHARLDNLSSHIERMTGAVVARAPSAQQQRLPIFAPSKAGDDRAAHLTGAPARNQPIPAPADMSIDQAVAEITERQRALNGAPRVSIGTPLPPPPPPAPSINELERLLKDIASRMETLQPASELEKSTAAIRADLAEIQRLLTEALPRRAVESLEIEIRALAERIDHSRQSGVEPNALAGLERGLTEVREALRGLTTAENLVGFDDAVQGLAQKLDQIASKEDPAALQQLETAIGALRGIVSHVASNDTLTKVAEDVRSLAAKVDSLANNAMSGTALSALENRIDTLTSALTASAEAGHAVPHELEKMLAGLIEKLEWVQLTHTDHAALAHLEDRIAMLVQRFDASDSRLSTLEAVERGLADLLVHIERMRGSNGPLVAQQLPAGVDTIERDVATIKQSERRTRDSLEAVQGTVEHVVDRLAMIESDLRVDTADPASAAMQMPMPAHSSAAQEPTPMAAAPAAPPPPAAEPAIRRPAVARPPIDPDLPPDHPLEPGSATRRARGPASAADRIAASEDALASAKPAAASGNKSDFIAAARRAAQAAASTSPDQSKDAATSRRLLSLPKNAMGHLRKLFVAAAVLMIVVGCVHIASRFFDDGSSGSSAQAPAQKASPPAAAPSQASPAEHPAAAPPSIQVPDATPSTTPSVSPGTKSGTTTTGNPARQSNLNTAPAAGGAAATSGMPLWITPDVTGSIGRPAAPPTTPAVSVPAVTSLGDKLPATIGGPVLRAAAIAGDASAAYEVAMRFADGRGVPQSAEEEARWLERAAKQGLAPAQFRLGSLYEKGIGVKKDLAAARDFYLAAADKGNGKAMHNLAVLYAEGINNSADYRTAAHWFRKAADRGIPDSQYNLGILYARGIGVEQNYAESYKWFDLAAKQGDKEAATKRDEVAAKLDKQSLEAARLAVQTWNAEPQPDEAINVKAPPGGWDATATRAQPPKSKPRPSSAKAAAPEPKVN